MRIALERARIGRPAKSAMLVGLRGVGKTVLLDRIRMDAEKAGIHTVRIKAPEGCSLPALLAPQLRQALLCLSQIAAAKDYAVRGLRALAGFVGKLKVVFSDIEVGIDYEPEPGLEDNGDLEHDLQALFEQVGLAAKSANTALAIFVDEMQYVEEAQLAALITAMHRTEQRQLPIVLVGAGLPQLRGQMGNAKSYAERLFDFPMIGPLPPAAARLAIEKPLENEGVAITERAVIQILQLTQGYAYFVQQWGSHTWRAAQASPIDIDAVDAASVTAVSSLAPTRSSLITKGMIWSPNHGDTAFTVPMFDEFMKRIMPGDDWR